MASPKKKSNLNIDFSGVESGGRNVPEGEYLVEVSSIEEKESQEGNQYLAWKWKIVDGPYKGATLYDNTSLKPTALWRLKTLLECLGIEASGKTALNFKEYIGKSLLVEVTLETYQGKQKPRITGFLRGIPTSAPVSDGFKKGSTVKFAYEGSEMEGEVVSTEGSKVIVLVTVDDEQEEWELDKSEVTLG